MGGRGAFLKEGGFIKQRYKVVDFIEGIKILRPKDDRESLGLPERSGTPNTSYVCYKDNSTFKQFITFDEDRMPRYRIDYGTHQGKVSLHVHFYAKNGIERKVEKLHTGHKIYQRHKRLFKGVPVPNERN